MVYTHKHGIPSEEGRECAQTGKLKRIGQAGSRGLSDNRSTLDTPSNCTLRCVFSTYIACSFSHLPLRFYIDKEGRVEVGGPEQIG
jgi:hypothetical protein